jgi:hypothetical protein
MVVGIFVNAEILCVLFHISVLGFIVGVVLFLKDLRVSGVLKR